MIFQKIITNSIVWSFLISGFTGLLAFNGRNKIFSIINKSILTVFKKVLTLNMVVNMDDLKLIL